MPSKKVNANPARSAVSARKQPTSGSFASQPQTVSARWLAAAVGVVILAAATCVWATLCFMFWQGSWQLLYRPSAAVVRTPANDGMAFDSIGFASDAAGSPQLHGWWIPAGPGSRYTAIYLHGANGNMGYVVDALIPLHGAKLNVFAIDYRGYGLSHFEHPSEAHWREDAESALHYLVGTRHIAARSIVLVGKDLGADLALEVAAAHPELAGVIVEEPVEDPARAIFNDPRARLVPSHALVGDRWDVNVPAANLHIPSLWFFRLPAQSDEAQAVLPEAYKKASSTKSLHWIANSPDAAANYYIVLSRWLDALPVNSEHA